MERPILFSGPMVRAILAGKKTVTRRVYKPLVPPPYEVIDEADDGALWPFVMDEYGDYHALRNPYGNAGDTLWVRETFYCDDFRYPNGDIESMRELLDYRATHDCGYYEAGCPCRDESGRGSWRPSIFMPRWASRITLGIKSVRIERLQDITPYDVVKEGLSFPRCDCEVCRMSSAMCPADTGVHLEEFAALWDSINGKKHPWQSNPWVWVISFEAIDRGDQ